MRPLASHAGGSTGFPACASCTKRLLPALLFLFLTAIAGAARAEDTIATRLEYNYNAIFYPLADAPEADVTFRKEPQLPEGKVYRRMLKFGENEYGLLWHPGAKQLYLDDNRNLDLTDDPGNPRNPERAEGTVLHDHDFPVYLKLKSGALTIPYRLDLDISMRWMRAGITSGWTGSARFSGKEYRIRVIDTGDPGINASDRIEISNLSQSPEPSRDFSSFPTHAYIEGRQYKLTASFEGDARSPNLILSFAPEPVDLSPLKLVGTMQHLVLADSKGTQLTVYDKPVSASLSVPVGKYDMARVLIDEGTWTVSNSPFTVEPGRPTNLKIGGPLRRAIVARQHGTLLDLDYSHVGVGGETYQAAAREGTPSYTLEKGAFVLASGMFRYG